MRIKINKNNSILILAICIIAILIIFIVKLFSDIKTNGDALTGKRNELEYTQQKNSDIAWVANKSKEDEEALSVINKCYIKKSEALTFITDMESIAGKINLPDPEIDLSENLINQGNEIIPIQITITGSFDQIVRYLVALEGTDYFIDTSNIKLTAAATNDITGLKAQILSTTHWE